MNINNKKMESTVLKRIRSFIKYVDISDRKFAEVIDVPQTTISSLFKRGNEPNISIISAILKAYPCINIEWLLTGRGEMLKSEETAPVVKVNYEGKGVPYYADLPVSAGQLDTFVQQSEPTGWVNLPGVNSKALFPVIGCSMKPEINPGDVVGIVQIDSWEVLDPDKTYLIITHDERMIKHLAVDEEDDSVLWCISPNYPKFKINKADIKHLYRISFCAKLM